MDLRDTHDVLIQMLESLECEVNTENQLLIGSTSVIFWNTLRFQSPNSIKDNLNHL